MEATFDDSFSLKGRSEFRSIPTRKMFLTYQWTASPLVSHRYF
jgi:hypothetical protein